MFEGGPRELDRKKKSSDRLNAQTTIWPFNKGLWVGVENTAVTVHSGVIFYSMFLFDV